MIKNFMVDISNHSLYLATSPQKNLNYDPIGSYAGSSNSLIEFNATEPSRLFANLKKEEFTGRLILQDPQGIDSVLYLYLGRLVYACGGIHPRRRWQRHLKNYCPQLPPENGQWLQPQEASPPPGGEYHLLTQGIQAGLIHREQFIYLIRSTISEILFDLMQAGQVSYQLWPEKYFLLPVLTINAEQAVSQAGKLWQAWQAAKLADRSPHSAPLIKPLQGIQDQISPLNYQLFRQRFTGQATLRELAVELNQDLLRLTHSLMPYVQSGWLDLVAVPDFAAPGANNSSPTPPDPLLLYIAPDLATGTRLRTILAQQGYELLVVPRKDSLEASSLCLEKKPAAIFLSSELTPLDGYQICRQLRQIPLFRPRPIFLITKYKSLKDKIRARMVGASSLLDKSNLLSSASSLLAQHLEKSWICND
jgi:chemotaxis family two-component system response regulator PixG